MIKINENLFSYSDTGDDRILEIDFPTRKAKKHKRNFKHHKRLTNFAK